MRCTETQSDETVLAAAGFSASAFPIKPCSIVAVASKTCSFFTAGVSREIGKLAVTEMFDEKNEWFKLCNTENGSRCTGQGVLFRTEGMAVVVG